MKKKYKLLKDDTIIVNGTTLYRIEAVCSFNNVDKGNKGGYIENEKNLSQIGNCWVFDNSIVYDKAKVYGNAQVFENSIVCDNAKVFNNALVYGKVKLCDNAEVCGNATVYKNALIYNYGKVCGNATVSGSAKICDYAGVYGNAVVEDNAVAKGNAMICDNAFVGDNAIVCGNSIVDGRAEICGNAEIRRTSDYYFGNTISGNRKHFTYTRSNKMWKVKRFYGTGKDLIEKTKRENEINGREFELIVKYVEELYSELKY